MMEAVQFRLFGPEVLRVRCKSCGVMQSEGAHYSNKGRPFTRCAACIGPKIIARELAARRSNPAKRAAVLATAAKYRATHATEIAARRAAQSIPLAERCEHPGCTAPAAHRAPSFELQIEVRQ